MPDLYIKVSIHHPELAYAEMDVMRLADRLMDKAIEVFPLSTVTVTTRQE